MRERAGVRNGRENLIQLVANRLIGVIAVDEEQGPPRPAKLLPLLERDLHAIATVKMNLGETADQPAMLLAGMFDVACVRRQIDRMNLIAEPEGLVAFVKD